MAPDGAVWQARRRDPTCEPAGPADAAGHALAVLPGLLRRAGLDHRAGRDAGQRRARAARLHRPAGHRPRSHAPGRGDGRRLAAGVPGGGDRRPTRRTGWRTGDEEEVPDAAGAPGRDHRGGARGARHPRRSASPGYEADDVIGTLATRVAAAGRRGHRRPRPVPARRRRARRPGPLHGPRRRASRGRSTRRRSTAKYGIPGRSYADFATLRGDPSDGLPGVPGSGRRPRRRWSTRYGTWRGSWRRWTRATPAMPAGARAKLTAARDYLAVAPVVVAVAKTCRCRRTTTPSRGAPRTPNACWSSPSAGGSTAPSTGC